MLKAKIRSELITSYWDELLRLVASLRRGWAPASLLLARLQAESGRNPLAQALQEYGRLVKTSFIRTWLAAEELHACAGWLSVRTGYGNDRMGSDDRDSARQTRRTWSRTVGNNQGPARSHLTAALAA